MSGAYRAGASGGLDAADADAVWQQLPLTLMTVSSTGSGEGAGTLYPGVLLGGRLGSSAARPTTLTRLVEPGYLAAAVALLARSEPDAAPTATRLVMMPDHDRVEVLASCRLLDAAEPVPLLAFLEAPPESDVDAGLRRSDQLLAAAERISHLGSWQWDIANNEVRWSDELYRLYGYEPGEIDITLPTFLEHTIPEDRDYSRSVVEHGLVTNLPFTYMHRIKRADGEVRTLYSRGSVTAVDASGHPLTMVGTCRDVSMQQELQEEGREYRQLYEREREVAGKLREVEQVRDALIASVSHDLRTPLTVIVGSAITLRDHREELGDATRAQLISNMAENAERLDAILGDLLDLDRVRRGVLEPNLALVDLRELARQVLRTAGPEADRITLVDGPAVVARVDGGKVERILENLVRNAIRHTPAGTPVWIRIEQDDSNATITVEDSGAGVPPDLRARVFEPFERGASAMPGSSGSGLGLAIVSRFALLHGGSAWVDDREGGGAAFHVRLPLAPSART